MTDSNRRHPACKAGALPTELTARAHHLYRRRARLGKHSMPQAVTWRAPRMRALTSAFVAVPVAASPSSISTGTLATIIGVLAPPLPQLESMTVPRGHRHDAKTFSRWRGYQVAAPRGLGARNPAATESFSHIYAPLRVLP